METEGSLPHSQRPPPVPILSRISQSRSVHGDVIVSWN